MDLFGPATTLTEGSAPRLVKLQHFLHLNHLAHENYTVTIPKKKPVSTRIYFIPYFVNLLLSVVFYCCLRSLCTVKKHLFMSGSHSPHSSLATPTPTSLVVLSRNMHSLPTTSPAVFNTHISSDGQHSDPGKYTSTSTSPSFASVVSSSAGSSAIPVTPSSFQSQPAYLSSTIAISSSSLTPQQHQQNLYQHHQQQQKHEQGQTSSPSAALLSNCLRNSAPLRAPSSVTSSSQSNRSPSSSSTYDSTLTSPASRSFSANQSSNGSTGPDQSGSDSSDVEIYLNTLVLHESVSRMQGMHLVSFILFSFSERFDRPCQSLFFYIFPCQRYFFTHIFTHFHRICLQIQ